MAALLLGCLALGGCTLLQALRPPPTLGPTDAAIPPDMRFTMSDAFELPARVWLPPRGTLLRGVILALHGYIDSRDAWEIPAPVFAAAGYALYAPDQRGFGGTADRGAWAGTARMVDDAAELAMQLRARHPGLPLIVMGESMGGAIAMVLAARPAPSADAFVLSAPAVWGWGQLAPSLAFTLRAVDWVAPNWAPDPGRVGQDLYASDNFSALVRLGHDPLTIRAPTVRSTKGLVDLMADAQNAAPLLHGRVLLLDGRRDRIVPPAATHEAWTKLPASVRRAFYPNGYHLLLRDNDRVLVETDILAWLANPDTWLPSGADIAAAAWLSDQAWTRGPIGLLPAAHADTTGLRPVWPY